MTTNKNLEHFFNQYEDIIQTGLQYDYSEKEIYDVIYSKEFNNYLRKGAEPRLSELNHTINFVRKFRNGELHYNTKSEQRKWVWHSESNSCPVCQERDGRIYDEKPEPAHPNCNCEFEEIDEEMASKYKEKYRENIKQRDDVANDLKNNALPKSEGNCAKYVTNALKTGGIDLKEIRDRKYNNLKNNTYACQYGNYLIDEEVGFQKIPEGKNYEARKGDIKIYQPYDAFERDGKKYPKSDPLGAGHMQMFDGEQWISDFRQGETPRSINNEDKGLYPNAGYENSNTSSQIYRYPKWQEWK